MFALVMGWRRTQLNICQCLRADICKTITLQHLNIIYCRVLLLRFACRLNVTGHVNKFPRPVVVPSSPSASRTHSHQCHTFIIGSIGIPAWIQFFSLHQRLDHRTKPNFLINRGAIHVSATRALLNNIQHIILGVIYYWQYSPL